VVFNHIGHIHIFSLNYLLRHSTEGKIEGKRRQGKRSKQLLDDLKEKRRFWNLKEEELDSVV
jgi:hypothetical protein